MAPSQYPGYLDKMEQTGSQIHNCKGENAHLNKFHELHVPLSLLGGYDFTGEFHDAFRGM